MVKRSWLRSLRSNRRSPNLYRNQSRNLNASHHMGEVGELRSLEWDSLITNSKEEVYKVEQGEEGVDTGKANLVHLLACKEAAVRDSNGHAQREEGSRQAKHNVGDIKEAKNNKEVLRTNVGDIKEAGSNKEVVRSNKGDIKEAGNSKEVVRSNEGDIKEAGNNNEVVRSNKGGIKVGGNNKVVVRSNKEDIKGIGHNRKV